MGLANILRLCSALFLIMPLGLFVGIHIFTDSWFVEEATEAHFQDGKTLANMVIFQGVGIAIIMLLSSFIKDISSAKIVLLGVSILTLMVLTTFIANQVIFDASPPIPIWVILGLAFLISIYGRFKVNRM
tara:strand:+ start:6174 stop:6563 length:390 start_codon:yes stop_codon:yes gene_type:complete